MDFQRGLLHCIFAAAPVGAKPIAKVCVGYSGGLDSTVVLHALRRALGTTDSQIDLSAIHVHHGLSPNADAWADHCLYFCRQQGIPLLVRKVQVDNRAGDGIEGAARRARYEVFEEVDADLIVLGHHQDDQAETVLFNFLRGASVLGGAAIPDRRGRFIRPLLSTSRSALRAYAQAMQLSWIEDESNDDLRFTRNFLRKKILPELETRFPRAKENLAHAAARFAEAQSLLEELAIIDGANQSPLLLAPLRRLSKERAVNALAFHLRQQGIRISSRNWLLETLDQLLDSAADRQVRIQADGRWISRYQDQLVLQEQKSATSSFREWTADLSLMPWGDALIKASPTKGGGIAKARLSERLEFKTRQGGERLEVRPGLRRSLKDLMREAGIAPWKRHSLPLLFCGAELVWVPFVGISEKFRCGPEEEGISLEFDEASW